MTLCSSVPRGLRAASSRTEYNRRSLETLYLSPISAPSFLLSASRMEPEVSPSLYLAMYWRSEPLKARRVLTPNFCAVSLSLGRTRSPSKVADITLMVMWDSLSSATVNLLVRIPAFWIWDGCE